MTSDTGFVLLDYMNIFSNPINIGLLILVALVIYVVFAYNSFIRLVNRTKEALADIDVQLKRRYDLIPNLINTVKGAANFETSTLEKVVEARNIAMAGSANLKEKGEHENMLTGALKSVFALSENYPELHANQNFLSLQNELSDTENKIQAARRFYNTNVRDLNIAIESFPGNIIAKMFKFTQMELFEVEDATQKEPVEVKF